MWWLQSLLIDFCFGNYVHFNLLFTHFIQSLLLSSFVFFNLEMPLPDRGNIFYAIKKDVGDVKFVVRKRTEHDRYKLKHTRAKSRLSKFLLNMWCLVILLAGLFLHYKSAVLFCVRWSFVIISRQVQSYLIVSVCNIVRS